MRVRYSFSCRRTRHLENIRKQRQKIPSIIKNVVEVSDIILEVLDARFADEMRNKSLEEEAKKKGKKIIYVLNKADLLGEKRKKHISETLKGKLHVFVSCKEREGIGRLRERIKIEAHKIKKKEPKIIKRDKVKVSEGRETMEGENKIVVGVIGYPNTGKSSLINLLVGKSVAKTAAEAGFTKGIQKLRLASDILLLDTPGVIPEEEYSHAKKEAIAKHTKFSARDYSKVKDPEYVVARLMQEHPNVFEKFYGIDAKGDAEILIEQLGREKGFLKKGGKVNEDKTARYILKEWQSGKIKI